MHCYECSINHGGFILVYVEIKKQPEHVDLCSMCKWLLVGSPLKIYEGENSLNII